MDLSNVIKESVEFMAKFKAYLERDNTVFFEFAS